MASKRTATIANNAYQLLTYMIGYIIECTPGLITTIEHVSYFNQ